GRCLDLLAVVDAFPNSHVDHDLLDDRNLHGILVAELLREALADDLIEVRAETRSNPLFGNWRLLVARRGLLSLGGLIGLVAFLSLLGLGLIDLFSLGRLIGLGGLLALFCFRAFFLGISHRSRLRCAWRSELSVSP